MSDTPTININDTEYPIESLPIKTQQDIQRVIELKERSAALSREFNETALVLQAYESAILEAVEPKEDVAEAS
jgi:hypothetical protein